MNKVLLSILFVVGSIAQAPKAQVQPTAAVTDETLVKEASSECMYCRRMDRNSGFLVSYSYCENSDECLMDAWNYINRDCASSW